MGQINSNTPLNRHGARKPYNFLRTIILDKGFLAPCSFKGVFELICPRL